MFGNNESEIDNIFESIRKIQRKPQDNTQTHHIFPSEIFKRTRKYSPFIQKAIAGGWDNNASYNLIHLSTSFHLGPHHGYSRMIEAQIEEFDKVSKVADWTEAEAFSQLQMLVMQWTHMLVEVVNTENDAKMK